MASLGLWPTRICCVVCTIYLTDCLFVLYNFYAQIISARGIFFSPAAAVFRVLKIPAEEQTRSGCALRVFRKVIKVVELFDVPLLGCGMV